MSYEGTAAVNMGPRREKVGIRPFLFGVLALSLALAGQQALQQGLWLDSWLFWGSGVLLFLSVFGPSRYSPIAAPQPFGGKGQQPDGWRQRVGMGLLAISLLMSVDALRQFYSLEPFTPEAWIWHGGAIVVLLAGVRLLDSANNLGAGWGRWKGWLRSSGWVGGLLLVALLLRLLYLDRLPYGLWYDEAEHGLQALRILADDRFRPIFEGAINGPAHYLYLVVAAFEWFGVSAQSIRLGSVLFGTLATAAGYLVSAELFGRRIAFFTATFLAVSSWSLTLSRFGMFATMSTPLFSLLTVAFFLRGLRTQRLTEYALAGLWLGAGLCFYTSFRLFVPVFLLWWVYCGVYEWGTRRQLPPKSFWVGGALLLFTAATVVAPLAVYLNKHPELFWARVENTFLFAGKDEIEQWPALWENLRRHLLMFNVVGDPNGRHNLPGAPMLDHVTAALWVLGSAYALRNIWQPRYLLLVAWLLAMLMGGVLSLDFEAPQSLRANGTLPAAYLLATIPLGVLARAWGLAAQPYYPNLLRVPALAMLGTVAFLNLHTYFVRQAEDFAVWNAYSTPETLAARLLADLEPENDAYVISFFQGHPTLQFLARDAPPFQTVDTLDQFPLEVAPGRGALLILNAEARSLYEEAQRLYPNAQFAEVTPPFPGPPVLYTVRLTPSDLDSLHGVTARYYAGADWHGPPLLTRHEQQLAADWTVSSPLPLPFAAEWEGFLHVQAAGIHQFVLEAPAAAELWIDEYSVLAGTNVLTGTLQLAEGIHTVRMRAQGQPGHLQLSWQTPELPLTWVPASLLYNAPWLGQGLLGHYYPNGQWMPPAAASRIEARFARYVHVTPLPRPYTVEWGGKLVAPQEGVYRFGMESIDESMLWIDGLEVVRTTLPNRYQESELFLTAGLHEIRIRFADRTNHTQINVYWQPPGRERQILPAEALLPPRGNYDRFVFSPPEPAENQVGVQSFGEGVPAARLPGEARVVAVGLATPRGVAVADDGRLYIAESGAGHVSIWNTEGGLLEVITGSNQPLVEPADLAVAEGRLLVLDATAAAVRWFDLDGNPLPDPALPGLDSSFAERSRGIGVTATGEIWVANTPAGRIVRLDAAGGMAGQQVVGQGEDAQPVDVVGGINGKLFVVDGQGHRLLRYAQDGQLEQFWSLPAANTLDSPHLATDRSGRLYVSDPENGRVFLRKSDGEVAGYWDLTELVGHPVRPVGIAVDASGVVWVVDSAAGSLIALRQG